MCLAVPMKLVTRDGAEGVAELGGVRRSVRLDLVLDDARPGVHLLVHAGYAIQIVDEDEARQTLAGLELLLGGPIADDVDGAMSGP